MCSIVRKESINGHFIKKKWQIKNLDVGLPIRNPKTLLDLHFTGWMCPSRQTVAHCRRRRACVLIMMVESIQAIRQLSDIDNSKAIHYNDIDWISEKRQQRSDLNYHAGPGPSCRELSLFSICIYIIDKHCLSW